MSQSVEYDEDASYKGVWIVGGTILSFVFFRVVGAAWGEKGMVWGIAGLFLVAVIVAIAVNVSKLRRNPAPDERKQS